MGTVRSSLVLVSMLIYGCATDAFAESPVPATGEKTWIPRTRKELLGEPRAPVVGAVCKADLLNAKELVGRVGPELELGQRELLNKAVVNAERAWVSFEATANATGVSAELKLLGARSLTGALASVQASMVLPILVVLWPSSIGPECANCPEPLRLEQRKTAEALREVSKTAEQIQEQIDAGRQRAPSQRPANAPLTAPRVNPTKEPKSKPGGQGQPPRKPPCIVTGIGGKGASQPEKAPPAPMRCDYLCDDIPVKLTDVIGRTLEDCETPENMGRAMREAARIRGTRG